MQGQTKLEFRMPNNENKDWQKWKILYEQSIHSVLQQVGLTADSLTEAPG